MKKLGLFYKECKKGVNLSKVYLGLPVLIGQTTSFGHTIYGSNYKKGRKTT